MDSIVNEWSVDFPPAPLVPPYPLEYLPEGAVRFFGRLETDGPLRFEFTPITVTLTKEL